MKDATILNIDVMESMKNLPRMLDDNEKVILRPVKEYKDMNWESLRLFCHIMGRYCLPTTELVEYLGNKINGRSAIEIGAGCGDLGYHLGIPMTDSFIQETAEVKAYYEAVQQPTIKYGKDVEKIEAMPAVLKYRPKVVVAAWVTNWIDPNKPPTIRGSVYGIKENKMLKLIKEYIMVGSIEIHRDKPILKKKHTFREANDIAVSRSNRNDNIIWHFKGSK